MRLNTLAVLLAAIITARCAAVPASHVLHEKRHATPAKWVKREKLDSKAFLPMRIGLKQRNLEKGHDFLMDVSDPASSNYAKHWTSDEVIAMFSPEQSTVDKVRAWLIEFGIDDDRIAHSNNKGWLAFDATTEEAEGLLQTEYYVYEHAETDHVAPACDSYYLPKHIQEHVDYVTPGIKLLAPKKRGVARRGFGMGSGRGISGPQKQFPDFTPPSPANLSSCDQVITPACIAALYQIPPVPASPPPNAGNSLGIFEEGDYYAQEDQNLFFNQFRPDIPNNTHPIPAFIDGAEAPVNSTDIGGESDLDFQLAYPIIYPQTITLYQTDDIYYAINPSPPLSGGFNTFLDALDGSYCTYAAFGETGNDPTLDPIYPDPDPSGYHLKLQCGVYTPTNVISVSYGSQEADLPAYYQQRQCNEFMKLGLQGHSIFFASGDSGVAGPFGGDSENGCLGPNATIFSPAWPNNCPYVTNVGATKVYPGKTVNDPESVANDPTGYPYISVFSSGGGFSNIYPRPSYQRDAVQAYFNNYDPGYPAYRGNASFGIRGGIYNRLGRAYPDVSANGDNTAVYSSGKFELAGGTSASAPIFASIVNRINELRLNAGKKSIGFMNPALYSNPSMLNDITTGSNPGCGTAGFPAAPGWDPSSGLGTPNFPKMAEYFLSLP